MRDAVISIDAPRVTLREAETLAECRSLLDNERFDVFLADLVLPDGHGIDAIRHACALPKPPTVLVISSLADEDVVIEAITAGAQGYVSKLDAPDEVARAISVAVSGGSCISPSIAERLMALLRRQSGPSRTPAASLVQLTECERSVLQLAARGHNYRQIAEINGTRPSTVYTHVRHIYEKLQVSNLAQALFEARRMRLV